MQGAAERRTARGGWAYGLALGAAACAVPLVVFGGSVTTLGAGMAVDGWLVAEGHFLPLFPLEKWFRDVATFVEHTHRLFGMLVGICALGAALLAPFSPVARGAQASLLARVLPPLALVAVAGQGLLGGLRVLEDSEQLAFLHGALAQAVFAVLAASALVLSPAWAAARAPAPERGSPSSDGPRGSMGSGASLGRLAAGATLLVYAQIVLGAMARHALRPSLAPGGMGLVAVHAVGAAAVLAVLGLLIRRLLEVPEAEDPGRRLARAGGRLRTLLLVQLLLGGIAWASYREAAIGPVELAVSVLHVLAGGLLLVQTSLVGLWTLRLRAPRPGGSPNAPALLGPSTGGLR